MEIHQLYDFFLILGHHTPRVILNFQIMILKVWIQKSIKLHNTEFHIITTLM